MAESVSVVILAATLKFWKFYQQCVSLNTLMHNVPLFL